MSSQSLIAQLRVRVITLEQENDSLGARCERFTAQNVRLHTELTQLQQENARLTQQVEVAKHSAIAQEQTCRGTGTRCVSS
jgi:predicted  nucleic acid-binding Zn-ribbon protein